MDFDSNASGFRTKADITIQVAGNQLKVHTNFKKYYGNENI